MSKPAQKVALAQATQIRIPADLRERLRQAAFPLDLSLSAMGCRLIEIALDAIDEAETKATKKARAAMAEIHGGRK